MSNLEAYHTYGNITSFCLGSVILVRSVKGDKFHKGLGFGFVASMIGAETVSFFIAHRGSWSALHALSAMSIYWCCKGIYVIQTKPKNYIKQHVEAMGSAFISTVIAGCGVAGRHLTICKDLGIHWLWYLVLGAGISIPALQYYIKSLKFKDEKDV